MPPGVYEHKRHRFGIFAQDYKNQINSLYWEQGLTIQEVALAMNSYSATIFGAMVRYGIPRRPHRLACSPRKRRDLNPMWKGDEASPESGRCRARRIFPKQSCSICGKKGEIHHVDNNPLNNEPSNIKYLCRLHHMIADGRYLIWMKMNRDRRVK